MKWGAQGSREASTMQAMLLRRNKPVGESWSRPVCVGDALGCHLTGGEAQQGGGLEGRCHEKRACGGSCEGSEGCS